MFIPFLQERVVTTCRLDPSVYPHFNIYNSTPMAEEEEYVVTSVLSGSLFGSVRLVPGYPVFDLCK